jgi:hypothetical protein
MTNNHDKSEIAPVMETDTNPDMIKAKSAPN